MALGGGLGVRLSTRWSGEVKADAALVRSRGDTDRFPVSLGAGSPHRSAPALARAGSGPFVTATARRTLTDARLALSEPRESEG